MQIYLDLIRDVIENGVNRTDRTGVGTRSVFGRQVRCDLRAGFPLLTTKRIHTKSLVAELLWFLSGSTNNHDLTAQGVTIWNEWAAPTGQLGPIYGQQWRSWQLPNGATLDQLSDLIDAIRKTPDSRRLVVSAWNPADLPLITLSPQDNVAAGRMALAPCHCLFQFYVQAGYLSCQLYQRSADLFLGVPFNIASYALLTHLVAQQCDLLPHELIISFGDLHLYQNHLTETIVLEQLRRSPCPLPQLVIHRRPPTLFDYNHEDIAWINYHSHPVIRAPIAV